MSYDFIVYVKQAELPAPDALEKLLAGSKPAIVFRGKVPDFQKSAGLVPVFVDGAQSGFQVSVSPIVQDDIDDFLADVASSGQKDDEYLAILQNHDRRVTFRTQNAEEQHAGRLVALALAAAARGHFMDPQTSESKSFRG